MGKFEEKIIDSPFFSNYFDLWISSKLRNKFYLNIYDRNNIETFAILFQRHLEKNITVKNLKKSRTSFLYVLSSLFLFAPEQYVSDHACKDVHNLVSADNGWRERTFGTKAELERDFWRSVQYKRPELNWNKIQLVNMREFHKIIHRVLCAILVMQYFFLIRYFIEKILKRVNKVF